MDVNNDVATMAVTVTTDGVKTELQLDVLETILLAEPIESKHDMANSGKITPSFLQDLSVVYSERFSVKFTPSGAYYIYCEASARFDLLKKSMPYLQTSLSSMAPESSTQAENKSQVSTPTSPEQ